jgi:hypothetical protein
LLMCPIPLSTSYFECGSVGLRRVTGVDRHPFLKFESEREPAL